MILLRLLLLVKCISGFVGHGQVTRPIGGPGSDGMHYKPMDFTTRPIAPLARMHPHVLLASSSGENPDDLEPEYPVIMRAEDAIEIDGSIFEDIESGKPPEWMIMKELLGINIFTYILAGLILFFFSMNLALGPGWLGQVVGIEGTGSIKEVSDALPDNVDLTSPEFKLDL